MNFSASWLIKCFVYKNFYWTETCFYILKNFQYGFNFLMNTFWNLESRSVRFSSFLNKNCFKFSLAFYAFELYFIYFWNQYGHAFKRWVFIDFLCVINWIYFLEEIYFWGENHKALAVNLYKVIVFVRFLI